MSGSRAWAVRGLGLVTFTSLVGASTGVTGTGGITGKAVITQSGTYTVTQNIDLSGTDLGAGVPVISIALSGGQVTLDLDDHSIERGPGGPVIELICGAGGGQVVIKDGKVESGSENIRSTSCDVVLESVVAAGANQSGVHAIGGSLAVHDSVIRGSGRHGIEGDAPTLELTSSSIINPALDGLALQEATQMEITGSVIRGAGRHGIDIIEEIPIPSYSASFTDVRVLGSGGDGYHVQGGVALTVTGGLVRGSGGHGFVINGNNEHELRIAGVKISDTAGPAAILLNAVTGDAAIVGNQIRGFAGDGVVAAGSPTATLRLEGNLVSAALGIQSSDTEGIQSSDTEGFRVDDVSVNVVGNTLEGAATGMLIDAAGAVIARNTVRMVTSNGIVVAGGGAVVRDNVLAGHGAGVGILAANGNNNVYVKANTVRRFATGLSFAPGTTVDANGYYRGNTIVETTTAVVGGIDGGDNILF